MVVTFFFWPSAGPPPSYPWFGIHVPLPPRSGQQYTCTNRSNHWSGAASWDCTWWLGRYGRAADKEPNGHQQSSQSRGWMSSLDRNIWWRDLSGRYGLNRGPRHIKISGGDDVDDDIVIKPHPTRREVLKAVSTIGACIEDLDDPNACKLEALLGLLNRQLHLDETWNMRDTHLTDFFQQL